MNSQLVTPKSSFTFSILFQVYLKNYNQKIDNPLIRIYVNKVENRITFKSKTVYYLELLTPEIIKLLLNTVNKMSKDENCENVPHLETTEVVLAHCSIDNNDYQQSSRVLYTFVPNKPLCSLLEISAKTSFLTRKTFNSEFQAIQLWVTDQNSQPLEIENTRNLT